MRSPHGPLHRWTPGRKLGLKADGQFCCVCGAARTLQNIHQECKGKRAAPRAAPDVRDERPVLAQREVRIDDESNKPMWYAWPVACPMYVEKAKAGYPKPMACVGGHIDSNKIRHRFAACWHTERGLLDVAACTVGCKYDPATDLWNRPLARKHPGHFEPEPLEQLQ